MNRTDTQGQRTSKNHAVAEEQEYVLRLYITGATPNSMRAVTNVKNICDKHLAGRYLLEIIDLYLQQEIAEQEQLVAVPMLVKISPLPPRKLIGDMSDYNKVMLALGLNP